MLIKPVLILYTILALTCVSCHKNNENSCISFQNVPISKVEGLQYGSVNQEIDLIVDFVCYNGCGKFGRIEESELSDTTFINVVAKYEGCVCTDVLLTKQAVYNFKPKKTGTYYLKFWQGKNDYLVDTIIVR